ncbi:Hypothetical predicted protein [Pelobates cultripes]|uniref:Uncharacterized protein n=1 Tax=Pelobates cultripes TaxID=61616 RepID=A0AAD1SG86_PELCU|nr:Hypothetical predicted protein [Pelobates cultripes]
MADGAAAKPMQQTNEEWAAAFNANFDAVCQRFWERMRERSSHPVQTPATTAAHRHSPPRKHAKHPSKALPLKERVQGTVARWWKRRRDLDRPKTTHNNQAKAPNTARADPPPPDRVIAAHNKQSSTTGMKACRHQSPTAPPTPSGQIYKAERQATQPTTAPDYSPDQVHHS